MAKKGNKYKEEYTYIDWSGPQAKSLPKENKIKLWSTKFLEKFE